MKVDYDYARCVVCKEPRRIHQPHELCDTCEKSFQAYIKTHGDESISACLSWAANRVRRLLQKKVA
jgi:hypothetical protein